MTEAKKSGLFYGYIIVLAAFSILAVSYGAHYSYGVFFKPLANDFGWTRLMTSGAYSLYMVLHGLLYIIAGGLSDKYGPRLVMTVCGLFLGVGYLLMSQINNIWHLYLFYGVIIAIGMSGGFVPLQSTIARWFVKKRGLMTGMAIAGIGIGQMMVPPMASWLVTSYSWRISYIAVGVLTLVLTVLAAQFLKREPGEKGLAPYGAGESRTKASSLAGKDIFSGKATRTVQFWMIFTAFLILTLCSQVIMVHIIPHMTDIGISAMTAANMLGIIGGISIAGRIFMGGVSDKIGSKTVLIICAAMALVAFLWLLVSKEMWMFYIFAIIFGFSYGGRGPMQSLILAENFGVRSHGVNLGIISVGANFGGAVGPFIAGYIFDMTGSYQLAFLISAALSVISLILIMLLTPPRMKEAG